MSTYLFPLLIAIQVISALTIIGLVLLQQGKGADMGSSFGSGSAGSIFGAAGSANFFSRMTKWAAVVFFASTLGLAYVGAGGTQKAAPTDSGSVMEGFAPVPSAAPTAPESSAVPSAPAASTATPEAAPATPASTTATSDPASATTGETTPPASSETTPAQ